MINTCPQPCANRLPCGVCRIMMCQCPKWFDTYSVTCTTGTTTVSANDYKTSDITVNLSGGTK